MFIERGRGDHFSGFQECFATDRRIGKTFLIDLAVGQHHSPSETTRNINVHALGNSQVPQMSPDTSGFVFNSPNYDLLVLL